MSKLSKNYRNDSTELLPRELRDSIDAIYLPKLVNISSKNPKILVVYSGGNAVGKSTLSTKIAKELHALIIENDAIKRAIMFAYPDIDRQNDLNAYTWRYSMEIYERLSSLSGNGLIVRDGIIDWYYDRILPIFEKAGYTIFVVQFNQSRANAINAIKARGDLPTVKVDTLLNQLDDHAIHQKRFRSEYSADVVLDDTNLYDHDAVIEKLKLLIKQLESASS